MSVYIKIKEAQLSEHLPRPLLYISSSDNTIKAEPTKVTGNHIIWDTSMISSSKEKKIIFQIKNQTQENRSYGKGELYYSSLRSHPEKQSSQTITLDHQGKLTIDVFYTERQNFIGEIAFYNFEGFSNKNVEETTALYDTTKVESRRLFEHPTRLPMQTPKAEPKSNFFFCCGEQVDDRLHTVEQDLSQPPYARNAIFSKQLAAKQKVDLREGPEAVQFYKGPCKSTNLFSCCDAGISDQKFTVIQDYYRDK